MAHIGHDAVGSGVRSRLSVGGRRVDGRLGCLLYEAMRSPMILYRHVLPLSLRWCAVLVGRGAGAEDATGSAETTTSAVAEPGEIARRPPTPVAPDGGPIETARDHDDVGDGH